MMKSSFVTFEVEQHMAKSDAGLLVLLIIIITCCILNV